ALLEGLDAADVQALRGIELERPAAGLGLWRAEAHPDLLADLVGEHADRVGAAEVAGQLAQRLRHQARLQADLGLPHLPFELDPNRALVAQAHQRALAELALDLGLGRLKRGVLGLRLLVRGLVGRLQIRLLVLCHLLLHLSSASVRFNSASRTYSAPDGRKNER